MGLLVGNPCDALERPRTVPSVARATAPTRSAASSPSSPTPSRGRRDRAILLVLVLTGRRRAEVIGLRAGDLSIEGETVFYTYRGKGGKRGRRELPRPAYAAICGRSPMPARTSRRWTPGVALAGRSRTAGHQQRHVLRAVPPVPPARWARPDRAPRPPPHRGEAPSRCRRLGRGGQRVPRPQLARGHDRLPPAARGRGGPDVAGGRGGDRGLGRRRRIASRLSRIVSKMKDGRERSSRSSIP